MTLRYLKRLQPILNKVGKEHNIPIDEGEFILGLFFKSFHTAISDPRVPKVMLPMFGTFLPKVNYIYRSLKASIQFFKGGGSSANYLRSRIERIWPIRNRLIAEKQGKSTWKEWRGEEVKQRFEKLIENEQEEKRKSKERVYGSDNRFKESQGLFTKIFKGLHGQDRERRKSRWAESLRDRDNGTSVGDDGSEKREETS